MLINLITGKHVLLLSGRILKKDLDLLESRHLTLLFRGKMVSTHRVAQPYLIFSFQK